MEYKHSEKKIEYVFKTYWFGVYVQIVHTHRGCPVGDILLDVALELILEKV